MSKSGKIKCILVDDDIISRKALEMFISKIPTLELSHIFESGTEAFDFLSRDKETGILFLDIMMPDINGIELLKSLTHVPQTIITSTAPDFAVDAFDLQVADYLVKPVTYFRFSKSVSRAISLLDKTAPEPEYDVNGDDLFIKNNRKIIKLQMSDILFIEAFSEYVSIFTSTNKYVIYSTMSAMEEKLNTDFMRIHRSYIVNLKKIEMIEDNTVLINGKLMPISKANTERFYAKLRIV